MVCQTRGENSPGEGFMNILEAKGRSHDFKGLKVLLGVVLRVKEGERRAVIGHNGRGRRPSST